MSIPGITGSMMVSYVPGGIISLAPAYTGITEWDLTKDGPLTINGPYSGTITPLDGAMVSVEAWGGGGGGAVFANWSASGGNGGSSTWNDGANVFTAGGGRHGLNRSGGVASGGDINLNGEKGKDENGRGGHSPNGGSGASGGSGVRHAGDPGGGGGGSSSGGGGGGAGAYVKKTFGLSSPATISVGNRGTGQNSGGSQSHGGRGRMIIAIHV